MSRQHCCTYCAVILLLCSCEPFAQDEPQDRGEADPNEVSRAADPNEAIRAVVRSYLEATQQGRRADAVALSYFQNDEERQAFEKTLIGLGYGPSQWDLRKEIHFVRFRRKGDDIRAMLLLPYGAHYLPMNFPIREVRGQLKIVPERATQASRRDLTPVEASIAALQEKLETWKTARGAALSEKCLAFKEQLKEEIEVLEYAEVKELQVFPGYGDIAQRLKLYQEVRDLSDEELQAKVIQEGHSAIERLSK